MNTLIHSTEKDVVLQQQFIFNTFWKNAIPFENIIKEIEVGIEPVKTEILENPKDMLEKTIEICNQSSFLCICTSISGMRLGYNDLIELYRS